MNAPSSHAAYHLWTIREIYSNASGSLQFIELFDPSGGQNFVEGQSIVVTSGGQTHPFVVPGSSLPGSTFNHALLFGTAGIHAAGGPLPDYIIPSGFLFQAGGRIDFFTSTSSGPYSALPTDGVFSRTWGDGNAPNTPQNYAGQIGFVTVPEPGTLALFGTGTIGFWVLARRRTR